MSDNDTAVKANRLKPVLIKVAVVVLLAAAVGATLYAKSAAETNAETPEETALPENPAPEAVDPDIEAAVPMETTTEDAPPVKLPTLMDLGATKCIPCKMMAPILEELKVEYKGKLEVVFIDVWKNPDAAKERNINLIPTQIFLDAEGKELFRHEGFFAKKDILAKWKELGVDLSSGK